MSACQQEEQRLAEMKRQEQEQKKLPEEQKAKDIAKTQHLENKEVILLSLVKFPWGMTSENFDSSTDMLLQWAVLPPAFSIPRQ